MSEMGMASMPTLDKLLENKRYSKLPMVLQAGVLSRKTARAIMDLDKWQMDDLYVELLSAGIIRGVSSGTFRATDATLTYLTERGY